MRISTRRRRIADAVTVGVNVVVEVRDAATGVLVQREEVHNRVVWNLRHAIRDVLNGDATIPLVITQFAVGTGDTPVADADVALDAELFRDAVTQRTAAALGTTLELRYYLGSTQANGQTLAEAGLLNVDGDLLARAVHNSIDKTPAVTVSYLWTLTVGAG